MKRMQCRRVYSFGSLPLSLLFALTHTHTVQFILTLMAVTGALGLMVLCVLSQNWEVFTPTAAATYTYLRVGPRHQPLFSRYFSALILRQISPCHFTISLLLHTWSLPSTLSPPSTHCLPHRRTPSTGCSSYFPPRLLGAAYPRLKHISSACYQVCPCCLLVASSRLCPSCPPCRAPCSCPCSCYVRAPAREAVGSCSTRGFRLWFFWRCPRRNHIGSSACHARGSVGADTQRRWRSLLGACAHMNRQRHPTPRACAQARAPHKHVTGSRVHAHVHTCTV